MTQMQSRMLAILILLLLLGLVLVTVVMPLSQYYQAKQDRLYQMQRHVQILRRQAIAAENNQQHLEQWQAGGGIGRYLFANESHGVAAARLQERIKKIVVDGGGQLLSTQTLPAANEADLVQIGVNFKIRSTVSVIKTLMLELEGGQPLLFADEFSVNHQAIHRTRASRSRSIARMTGRNEVEFQMSVIGYMLAENLRQQNQVSLNPQSGNN